MKWITYIFLPSSWTHHPTPLGHHRAPSWAPCVTQQLPTSCLFAHGSVYVSFLIFQFDPHLPCVCMSFLYVYVSIPPLQIGSPVPFFFRFHIHGLIYNICHELIYDICLFLADLLYFVWQTLGPSTSLKMTQFHFLLWLNNIPLYICTTSSLFIHRWTFRLLLCTGCCKQCCSERWGTCVYLNYGFLRIYAQ